MVKFNIKEGPHVAIKSPEGDSDLDSLVRRWRVDNKGNLLTCTYMYTFSVINFEFTISNSAIADSICERL